jgi:integrase
MPALIKKPGSDVWFIRFRHNGQDRIKSTGETGKHEARKKLKAAIKEVQRELTVDDRMDEIVGQLRNMPDAGQRELTRQRLLSKLQQAANRKMLIANAWAEWKKLPRTTGSATLAGYDAVWRQFSSWLTAHRPNCTHLGEITTADSAAYSKHLFATRVTVGTYKLHLSFLSRVWRELKTEAGLVENVWADLLKVKMDKNVISRVALSKEQLATIIKSATGELKNMYLVGLLTSLRLKDVALLDASKFDEASGLLSLIPFKTRRKGERARVKIPAHPQLLSLLKNPHATGLYFPEMAKRYKAMPSDVSKIIQDHFKACGIETNEPMTDDSRRKRAGVIFGFHSLRYSFVSLCAKKNTPQHVLSELVGHSTPAMTLHYSRSDDAQRAKAIKGLPTINI